MPQNLHLKLLMFVTISVATLNAHAEAAGQLPVVPFPPVLAGTWKIKDIIEVDGSYTWRFPEFTKEMTQKIRTKIVGKSVVITKNGIKPLGKDYCKSGSLVTWIDDSGDTVENVIFNSEHPTNPQRAYGSYEKELAVVFGKCGTKTGAIPTKEQALALKEYAFLCSKGDNKEAFKDIHPYDLYSFLVLDDETIIMPADDFYTCLKKVP